MIILKVKMYISRQVNHFAVEAQNFIGGIISNSRFCLKLLPSLCIHHNHRTSFSANLTTTNQQTSPPQINKPHGNQTSRPFILSTVGPRTPQISTATAANSTT